MNSIPQSGLVPKTWQNVALSLGTVLGGMKHSRPKSLALQKAVPMPGWRMPFREEHAALQAFS